MDNSSVHGFIKQLNQVPPEVQSLLGEIRDLDKQVLELEVEIQPEKQSLLERIVETESKSFVKHKKQLEEQFEAIQKKSEKQIQLTKKKIILAQKLYNCIDLPTEMLDKELADKQNGDSSPEPKQKHSKSKRFRQQNEWEYDAFQPQYCYCNRPSFGSMVMCENSLCQIQWFHVDCVEEKITSGEQWFCRDCRKGRTKVRKEKKQHGNL